MERCSKDENLYEKERHKKGTSLQLDRGKKSFHTFISGDKSHPLYDRIYEALKDLLKQIKREGYIPDTSEVFHDVEEEQKKYLFFSHSERLVWHH